MALLGRKRRNRARRLRATVDGLPRHTRVAMLRGIEQNRILAGAYVDKPGGAVCPMLAAHRNGGRTSYGTFARAWDRFTGARRPRLATRREVATLVSYLEMSLLRDEQAGDSMVAVADEIRRERRRSAERAAAESAATERIAAESAAAESAAAKRAAGSPQRHRPTASAPADTGDRDRSQELKLRRRWAWLVPTRRYDVFTDLVAAAQEELAEQSAAELSEQPVATPSGPGHDRTPSGR